MKNIIPKKPHWPTLFAQARSIIKMEIVSDSRERALVLEMFDYGARCHAHLHPDPTKSGELAPQKGGE